MRTVTAVALLAILMLLPACSPKAVPLGGPVEPESLTDGVYTGEAETGPVSVAVSVTVEHGRISSVAVTGHDGWKGKKADAVIPQRIVEKQSTQVEAVSGATVSSVVMMNAVEDALAKARQKPRHKNTGGGGAWSQRDLERAIE